MPKTYVLDTNVLLHNPEALFAFQENNVVIPFAVIEEVDNQKKRQDEIGRNARVVSQKLDGLRLSGRLSEGVPLPNGGQLWIELNHSDPGEFGLGLDSKKHDNRILTVAYNLKRENHSPVILVTKDLNLRLKADVLGIPAEDFINDKVDYDQLYTGAGEILVSTVEMETFFQEGKLCVNGHCNALPHQFFVLRNRNTASQSALCRYSQNTLWSLAHGDSINWGIRALNKEQRFAFELLLDDSIKVVTLVGRAGTGKTLLALAVGLEKVVEQNTYTRLLVTRPVIPMGDDLGYLPGSKEEKLRPWMQPIYDNLEYLLRDCQDPFDIMEDLRRRGVLEMEALTYIRGRSIPRQFIICDEAQNLSPHMIKTLITRVGEGSKIVFTGDPEQIDHPYLDASSNGLSYLVEKLKGEDLAGHITLRKGERSRVAEMGARLL
ncbi:MAG: PhoH family protein [Deltaproteobacteria bacterium]|nr:PhoH family protein [Deltaproteobacteria bacterium]